MLLIRRGRKFFWDWSPPLFLILGYDYLRGLVPHLTDRVNIWPMIQFDQFFFGTLPTITLQHWLFIDGIIHWYDYYLVILYFLHFVIPMIIALLFWFTGKTLFKQYMAGMVVLSYMAFFTYWAFPAMPPWMASQQGFIPMIAKIMEQTLAHFAHPISLPTVYKFFGANLIAAVPSLHAGYPFITWLFIRKKWKKFSWVFFIYVLSIWFGIVYLGEHYVFDIVIAVVYCLIAYAITTRWNIISTIVQGAHKLAGLKERVPSTFDEKSAEER